MSWIPCAERLPDDGERVLAWADSLSLICVHIAGTFWNNGAKIKATHWQPLPPPPDDR